MKVPRPSVSATGVSIALYYLAYCEDAMERICLMSQTLVSEVVKYALWLLSSAHDSGRCHATMFFGLSFQFKIILDEFDNQDGLRKLYNVVSECIPFDVYLFFSRKIVFFFYRISCVQISVLPILGSEDHGLNDDEECAARQMIRHVSVALKKYMESHLFYKYTQMSRLNEPINSAQSINLYRVSVIAYIVWLQMMKLAFLFSDFSRHQNYCPKQLANKRQHCRRCFQCVLAGNPSIKFLH